MVLGIEMPPVTRRALPRVWRVIGGKVMMFVFSQDTGPLPA
jgi:hypothetical protein